MSKLNLFKNDDDKAIQLTLTVGLCISSLFSASSSYDLGRSDAFAGVALCSPERSCVNTIFPGPLVSQMLSTRFPAPSVSRVTYLISG